jgi:hypothetical protein
MIETLRHIMTPRPQAEGMVEETIESVALAGAAAIQRLIADRDTLRDRVITQQRELVTLNMANEELRCRLGLIRQPYLELGPDSCAAEQFDRVTREAILDNQALPPTPQDEANLIALAHRLKPNNGPA